MVPVRTSRPEGDLARADPAYALWTRLAQARDAVYRLRQKELNQYGLTTEQSMVLFWVHELGDRATPARLSRRMFRKSQSVSELLERMSRDGLVAKTKDLERKNLVRVSLTEKGRAAYEQTTERESIHKVMSALSDEQRRQLSACLETVHNSALQELHVKAVPPTVDSLLNATQLTI